MRQKDLGRDADIHSSWTAWLNTPILNFSCRKSEPMQDRKRLMINVKAEAIFHSISMQKINQCQEQTKDINNTEAKQKINTHTHTNSKQHYENENSNNSNLVLGEIKARRIHTEVLFLGRRSTFAVLWLCKSVSLPGRALITSQLPLWVRGPKGLWSHLYLRMDSFPLLLMAHEQSQKARRRDLEQSVLVTAQSIRISPSLSDLGLPWTHKKPESIWVGASVRTHDFGLLMRRFRRQKGRDKKDFLDLQTQHACIHTHTLQFGLGTVNYIAGPFWTQVSDFPRFSPPWKGRRGKKRTEQQYSYSNAQGGSRTIVPGFILWDPSLQDILTCMEGHIN